MQAIHCHEPFASIRPVEWEERDGRSHCNYCGSIHPDVLIGLLEAGARLERSDMKYGWPHKFYVHHPDFYGKWYNEHLLDLDDPSFRTLTRHIQQQTRILFTREHGQFRWQYQ